MYFTIHINIKNQFKKKRIHITILFLGYLLMQNPYTQFIF